MNHLENLKLLCNLKLVINQNKYLNLLLLDYLDWSLGPSESVDPLEHRDVSDDPDRSYGPPEQLITLDRDVRHPNCFNHFPTEFENELMISFIDKFESAKYFGLPFFLFAKLFLYLAENRLNIGTFKAWCKVLPWNLIRNNRLYEISHLYHSWNWIRVGSCGFSVTPPRLMEPRITPTFIFGRWRGHRSIRDVWSGCWVNSKPWKTMPMNNWLRVEKHGFFLIVNQLMKCWLFLAYTMDIIIIIIIPRR